MLDLEFHTKEGSYVLNNQLTPKQRRLFGAQLVVQGSAVVALIVLLFKIVYSHFQFLSGRVLIAMGIIMLVQWGIGAILFRAGNSHQPKRSFKPNWMSGLAISFEVVLLLVLGIYFLSQS